jgi:serine/threonine protein kinase/tetratricopeptide (TPR) repeat protein
LEGETESNSLQNGRYSLLTKLGEGGKGVVYRAHDNTLDRIVAIKLLKGESFDEETYARFTREAQAAARLTHPNVVSTYDMGKEGNRYFLVMEYVKGTSLGGLMESHREEGLDPSHAVPIAMDVCRALRYAHSEGVVHRDVKPENIMITQDGTTKLMDFGLARAVDKSRLTKDGMMIGTPAYMAPENALGRESDARTDLYSLGCVLYEMLTGRPPFRTEDSLKLIYSQINDIPVSPSRVNPHIPASLEQIILRLLAKNPNDRFQSAADLLRALEVARQSVEGKAIRGQTSSPISQLESVSRKQIRTPPESRKVLTLIDRESEMEALKKFVDRTLGGEGGLVLLSGEAGIGKTRLAEEAKTYATLRGMRTLSGKSVMGEGASAYAPFIEMVREFIRESQAQSLQKALGNYADQVSRLVPDLTERFGGSSSNMRAPLPSLSTDPSRFLEVADPRFLEGITQFFVNISEGSPLLLLIDDLNWADDASIRLLQHLTRNMKGKFIAILGAYRDTDVRDDSTFSQLLLDLNRERLLNTIHLKPFEVGSVTRMMAETFGETDEQQTSEFHDLIFEKTGGNPFFIEEVLRSLVEQGIIFKTERGWKRKPIFDIEIPSSVSAVIKQRLGKPDEESLNVLRWASVIGKEFSFEVLQEVAKVDEDHLLVLMEKLLKSRLIREKKLSPSSQMYFFTDQQIRNALYDEISLVRRRKYHLRVGQTVEKIYEQKKGKLAEHASELAYHFIQGNDLQKALAYSIKAGDGAAELYAYEEASKHYVLALELLEEEGDNPLRGQVLEKAGDAAFATSQIEAAPKYWNEALRIHQEMGERRKVGDIYHKLGWFYFFTDDYPKAHDYFAKAIEAFEKEGDKLGLAQAYSSLVALGSYHWGIRLSPTIEIVHKALALAEEVEDHDAEMKAYNALASISKEKAKVFENIDRALQLIAQYNLRSVMALFTHVCRAEAYATVKADCAEVSQAFSDAIEFARTSGNFFLEIAINALLAFWVYLPTGEWKRAQEVVEGILSLGPRVLGLGKVYSLSVLGNMYLTRGELGKSEEYLKAIPPLLQHTEDSSYIIPCYGSLGRLFIEKGEYAQAEKFLGQGYEKLREGSALPVYTMHLIMIHSLLLEVKLKEGNSEGTSSHLFEIWKLANMINEDWAFAYAHRAEGMVAADKGSKAEGAINSFQKAADLWRKIGWPYEEAKTLYELGVASQQTGDKRGASEPLNQALEIFTRLGAKWDVEKVLARKELLKA